ncbi:MAG: glycosyltransferase family 4 protein [Candidatus Cloacimonetes bacterium]|nr:glycosyltransferase family 4 protein [Candidatus Cloacimonadota bacterium]
MRILQVSAQKPGCTGSGIYLQALSRMLAQNNHQQAILAGVSSRDEAWLPSIHDLSFFPIAFETPQLPFTLPGMSDVMPYASTRYQDLSDEQYHAWQQAFLDCLRDITADFQPDVIISHHLWLLTSLIKQNFPEIPLLAIAHGTGLRQLELAPRFRARVLTGCHQVDKVLALTEFQQIMINQVYQIPLNRIMVTGCAYDDKIFFPGESVVNRSYPRLVYCGKLARAKGVPQLIQAVTGLLAEYPGLQLELIGAGTGEDEKEICSLLRGYSANIYLKGTLEQPALAELFRQADILVLPSFYEGLPLVVLEALACGLRVVATDLPGLREWLGDDILQRDIVTLVPLPPELDIDVPRSQDLPAFETGLKQALDHQIKLCLARNRLSPAMIASLVQDHSWHNLCSRVENILQSMLP